MGTFAVTNQNEVIEAVNYAISNLGQGGNAQLTGNVVEVNTSTGVISTVDNPLNVIAYLYQYINIRYADSADGTSNFSQSPTNRLYYGVRNSAASVGSNNPADYIWNLVTGGFSTNKFLFYSVIGGRQIQFTVQTASPGNNYAQAQDGVAIDLDVITAAFTGQIITVPAYLRATSTPATPTGGTYDFATLTLTPPAGWSATIPAGSDPVYISQNTFESPASGTSAAPAAAWTTPVVLSESGVSTFTVVAYAVVNDSIIPSTPTGGAWNFGTNSGTPPTGDVTWYLDPQSAEPPDVLWTSYAIAQVQGSSGTDNTLAWSTPIQFGAQPGADGVSVFFYSVFQNSVSQPATPGAAGAYNFGTGVATPPAGWSNSATTPTGINVTWVTSARAFSGIPTGTWSADGSSWSTPAQYSGQTGAAGSNGVNGFTANVFPGIINYVMNNNGTYTAANTAVVATFSDGNITDSATVYSTINSSGVLNLVTGTVSANITVNPISNVSAKSLTVGFRHTSNSTATQLTQVASYPYVLGDPYAGSLLYGLDGQVVGILASAPSMSVTYTPTQYFTRDTSDQWTPPAVANVISTTANVVVTRAGNLQGYVNRNISFNAGTNAWSVVTGANFNASRFAFGTASTSDTNYFNTAIYTDPDGTVDSAIQIAVVRSGLTGNTGPEGSRGFLPMAYVVTPATPIGASSATLTSWFTASRTATSAPIGTGYSPIAGDTASFTWALGAGTPNVVATYNGTTWSTAVGQVINGNVIVDGTVTAAQINVNDIYAINIRSTNATLGNVSSPGYWFQANTGDARFGGNVSIGSNLTVGTIIAGSALQPNSVTSGTITAGAVTTNKMTANTINGDRILSGTITADKLVANAIIANTVVSPNATLGSPATGGYWLAGVSGSGPGYSYSVGDAFFGGNLLIAGNVNIGSGLISGSTGSGYSLGANTVTATQISNEAVNSSKILPGAVTSGKLAASAVIAGKIATDAVTANNIQANAVTATKIAAGAITTDKLAANLVIANDIRSTGATIGNFGSSGYWFQASSGNARLGGNVSIGGNLNVQGLITAGALNANAVPTVAIAQDAVSAAVIAAPDFPGAYPVPFLNNTDLWVANTRGLAISSGATITPTTTGSATGSRIQVNYGTTVFAATNSTSNLVELWKSGSSSYYQYALLTATSAWQQNGISNATDIFYVAGSNGTYGRSTDNGNTWTVTTSASYPTETFTAYVSSRTGNVAVTNTEGAIGGLGGDIYAVQGNLAPSIESFKTDPVFNVQGQTYFFDNSSVSSFGPVGLMVGDGGGISLLRATFGTLNWSSATNQPAPSGFINRLNSVAVDRHPFSNNGTGAYTIAVGSGGSIIRAQYSISGSTVSTTGWSQLTSGTTQNLNAIWCAYGVGADRNTIGTVWMAVGNNGTVLRSTNSGSTWQAMDIGGTPLDETANLYGVAGYINGAFTYWVVVGENGIFYDSLDGGNNWDRRTLTAGSDGRQRNLYAVAVGDNKNMIAVGENIIYRRQGIGGTPVIAYDGGAQSSSDLTRLAFFGSSANVAATAVPDANSQIGNQAISSVYYDTDYTAGATTTYYVVVGNLAGSAVTVNQPTLVVQEQKR